MNPFFMQTKARVIKLYGCLIDPAFRRALFVHGVAVAPEHRHVLGPDLATVVDTGGNFAWRYGVGRRRQRCLPSSPFPGLRPGLARFSRATPG